MRSGEVLSYIATVLDECIECKLCQRECGFLQKHGNPKSIAACFDPARKGSPATAFECSLCGLCAAVCPVGLNPALMLLEMRRETFDLGLGHFRQHSPILNYEKRGTSKRYSYFAFPEGCRTVLFPGCTLAGTHPGRVLQILLHLRKTFPSLGIVLDCCIKPSHDLGRMDPFRTLFGEKERYLRQNGVREVLVACPSCYRVFKDYAQALSVKTVYEVLAEQGLPETAKISGAVTVHDPCSVRFDEAIHGAVRNLVKAKGLEVEEMPHHGHRTLCCGEGGAVGFLQPKLAKNWSAIRRQEAQGLRIITYCAGCLHSLSPLTPTTHLLDLLLEPERVLLGKQKVSRAPFTYWNRIRLKGRLKKVFCKEAGVV
jgi:Fe-S oxidoreductase